MMCVTRMNNSWLTGFVLGLCLSPQVSADEPPAPAAYQLGHGLAFPAAHLRLGGYTSLRYRNMDREQARFDVRDLSLFATWNPTPRWQLFTELEAGEALTIARTSVNTAEAEFDVERLYADYLARPWLNLRVGKFLTPVGRWNLIHADPLVWTVSRPLVSSTPFARHAAGLAALGTVRLAGGDLEYQVYLDDSKILDPDRRETSFEGASTPGNFNAFDNAAGLQLRYHWPDDRIELAASYSNFRMRGQRERKQIFGLDGRLSWQGLELSSEAVYRHSQGRGETHEWGAFVQGVLPLFTQFHAIIRYEYFHGTALSGARLTSVGLAWRPQPPLVLKLELRDGAGNEPLVPDGLLASLAILF